MLHTNQEEKDTNQFFKWAKDMERGLMNGMQLVNNCLATVHLLTGETDSKTIVRYRFDLPARLELRPRAAKQASRKNNGGTRASAGMRAAGLPCVAGGPAVLSLRQGHLAPLGVPVRANRYLGARRSARVPSPRSQPWWGG